MRREIVVTHSGAAYMASDASMTQMSRVHARQPCLVVSLARTARPARPADPGVARYRRRASRGEHAEHEYDGEDYPSTPALVTLELPSGGAEVEGVEAEP